MEKVKKILKLMFYRYCVVFTLIVGINILALFVTGRLGEKCSTYGLLVIEAMAILCAFGELFYIGQENDSKRKGIIRSILHYCYINVVVIGVAWSQIKLGFPDILILLASIAVIYWVNVALDFHQNKKDALIMNDILSKINNNDE